MYIITDPKDVSDVYNNTASLSFDGFLHDIMSEFGTSARGIEKILLRKPVHSPDRSAKGVQSVSQIAHNLQVRQTQGTDLGILGEYVSEFYQKNLLLENTSARKNSSFIINQTDSSYIVSLKTWTAEVIINAGQNAYFGEALSGVDPSLPQTLIEFDDLSWQVFYQYPRFFRARLNKLSEQILDSLRKYLEMPTGRRQGKAWFTQALEEEYRKVGLTNEDIASQMLFLYWG